MTLPAQVINDPTQAPGYKTAGYLSILGSLLNDRQAQDSADQAAQLKDFQARTARMDPYQANQVATDDIRDQLPYLANAQANPTDILGQSIVSNQQKLVSADPNSLDADQWGLRQQLLGGNAPDRTAALLHVMATAPQGSPAYNAAATQLRIMTDANTTTRTQSAADIAASRNTTAEDIADKRGAAAERAASIRASNAMSLAAMKLAGGPQAAGAAPVDQQAAYWMQQLQSGTPLKDIMAATKDQPQVWQAVKQGLVSKQQGVPQTLNSQAAEAVRSSADLLQSVNQLMTAFEPYKNNNTMGYQFLDRARYALGKAPDGSYTNLADQISKLELDRVIGAARLLKGSSRSYQALQTAMVHLPDTWLDSPKNAYQKLNNLKQNLLDIIQDAQRFGKKNLTQGDIPSRSQLDTLGTAPDGQLIEDPNAALALIPGAHH